MTLEVPVIDIGAGLEDPATIARLAKACEEWGFFQITGHGLDPALRQEFFGIMTDFFALPKDQKLPLSRSADNFWGYFDRELTKNRVDQKEIFDIDANLDNLQAQGHSRHRMPWPDAVPEFRPVVLRWLAQMEAISRDLLGGLCLALGQSSESLNPFFLKNHSSFLRMNYYPVTAQPNDPENNLGIHPHTDAGALTVLAQDSVPGLQVRKGDTWHTIMPADDGLIINIGDMVQVWSNDRFGAPEHRVLASGSEPRFSAPYFYNPSYETVCMPLVDNTELPRYNPVPWGEFRGGRAAGDYADQGEEIQISWYRK